MQDDLRHFGQSRIAHISNDRACTCGRRDVWGGTSSQLDCRRLTRLYLFKRDCERHLQ
jgi:hypothetical protein